MKLSWRVTLGLLALAAVVTVGILPLGATGPLQSTPEERIDLLTEMYPATMETVPDPLESPMLRRFFLKFGAGSHEFPSPQDYGPGHHAGTNPFLQRGPPCTPRGPMGDQGGQVTQSKIPELILDDTELEHRAIVDAFPLPNESKSRKAANGVDREQMEAGISLHRTTGKSKVSEGRSASLSPASHTPESVCLPAVAPSLIPISSPETCSFTIKQRVKPQCNATGIVTVQDGGRLGNKLWEYGAVWALGKLLKMRPLVPLSILRYLRRYFNDLSVTALEDAFPVDCAIVPEALGEPLKRWRLLQLNSEKKLNNLTSRGNLVLHRWIVLPQPIIAFHGKPLKKEFAFHDNLIEKAERTLQWVSNEVNISRFAKNCTPADVVFVGVHVRRTDFSKWLPRVYNKTLATASYFHDAMNHLRKKIVGPLAFIVVSDDVKWVEINLGAKSRKSSHNDSLHGNDVFLGTDPEDRSFLSIGHDLALLSICNHSIIDYGTFGVWGALLSGGETISLRLDQYLDTELAKFIPGWTLWDDPGKLND